MIHRLIFIAALLTVPACNQPAAPDKPVASANEPVATSLETETNDSIDFARLHEEIKNCNEKELTYFDQNWEDIHAKLKRAVENQELAGLPMDQQEEMWDALAYLQSCRHPDIMHKHGAEMVTILFRFGTDDQLTLLRGIHPNGAQDAR